MDKETKCICTGCGNEHTTIVDEEDIDPIKVGECLHNYQDDICKTCGWVRD